MSLHKAAAAFCAASILTTALLLPGLARAGDDPTVEMARARFKEGVQFFDQKQYEKARLAFLQAYALKPHPAVLLNLAQSELRAGRPGDAATHFSEYLKKSIDVTAAQKQEATTGLAAAKAKAGEVTVSADAGAQISVDGEVRGTAPLPSPLYLSPGSHTIDIKSGDKKASRSVTAVAGQSTSVEFGSSSAAPPPPAAEPPGPAAPPKTEAPPPKAAETEPAEAATEPQAAESSSTEPPPEAPTSSNSFPEWFGRTPLAWVGAGVAVVGLGGGLTLALLSGKDHSNANSVGKQIDYQWTNIAVPYLTANDAGALTGSAPCRLSDEARRFLTPTSAGGPMPDNASFKGQSVPTAPQFATACSRFTSAANAGDLKETLAIVATSVGAAALIGTVVYYFIDTGSSSNKTASRRSKVEARVTPVLSPGLNGLSINGTF